ncbi:Gfo/Idh/MocA family oxidoreductase [Rhodobacteraceae bacterium CCMM004]|nr:Gfo/Idh/MocA family oxidoreductase [Rhodobacteraceae bacterium CCMM004]
MTGAGDRLGVGIVGCGYISTAYLDLIPRFAGLELRGVADLDPARAAARAAPHRVLAMGVEDLLSDPGIDVAVILTPPASHAALARQALDAGKHVWSEKPLALSLSDARALASSASARGLRLGAAPDTFLGGAHQRVRALVDAGAVGRVVSGTAHMMSRGMEHWHPDPGFFYGAGGGPILDMGPYYVANLVQILGPVAQVSAAAVSAFAERVVGTGPRAGTAVPVETPTTVHALLTFASGAVVTLGASWDVTTHGHAPMELYGTQGTVGLGDPNHFGGAVRCAGAEGRPEPLPPWDHPLGVANEDRGTDPPRANYRGAGLAEMAAALREGRPHRCAPAFVVHVLEVLLAILAAAESGQPQSLTTTCERPAPLPPDAARALLR